MSGKVLAVILYGRHVADLEQGKGGQPTLTYIDTTAATPVSLSMPVAPATYTQRQVRPFLEGLLPDRQDTRAAMGREFGVSGANSFALLANVGLDCAGAVQICPPSDVADVLARKGTLVRLTRRQIAHRLAALRVDPTAGWRAPRERWSLAGAQAKFALRRQDGHWCEATGSEATSHIIKPGVDGFRHQALNEHVCLATAAAVGLRAARSTFTDFDGEPALVVERYDRRRDAQGHLLRLHQEDACQALSVRPADKYESDGGPRAATIVRLLANQSDTANRAANIDDFLAYLAFNYLTMAPDAHAKNYSVLLLAGQVRVAPLYDVASAAPYDVDEQPGLRSAAMAIGGVKEFGRVRHVHWVRLADETGLDAGQVVARVRGLAESIPDAMADIFSTVADIEGADELRDRMLPRISQLCASTTTELGRPRVSGG